MTDFTKLIDAQVCFACGTKNKIGLHVKSRIKNKKYLAEFTPTKDHQSYKGIIHGGIIATLLDESMGGLAFKLKLKAVTANLNINLRKPVKPGEKLFITGEIIEEKEHKFIAQSTIRNKNKEVVADATGILVKVKEK